MEGIDSWASGREDLRTHIYEKHKDDHKGMKVGDTKKIYDSIARSYTSELTKMVNLYDLQDVYSITMEKKQGWRGCYFDVTARVDYQARDTTDFNPGQAFGSSFFTIEDQLIIDCQIGKAFTISATADWSDSWWRYDDPLQDLKQ